MKTAWLIIIIFCVQEYAEPLKSGAYTKYNKMSYNLPNYLIKYCRRYDIDIGLAYRWGLAESSHRSYMVSPALAYGRYQITEGWLREYERITKCRRKDVSVLLDDDFNCYLWAWTIAFWRRQGYNDKQIAQVYLFGEYGFIYNGRFSQRYEDAIFE